MDLSFTYGFSGSKILPFSRGAVLGEALGASRTGEETVASRLAKALI